MKVSDRSSWMTRIVPVGAAIPITRRRRCPRSLKRKRNSAPSAVQWKRPIDQAFSIGPHSMARTSRVLRSTHTGRS